MNHEVPVAHYLVNKYFLSLGRVILRENKSFAFPPDLAPERLIKNEKILGWFEKDCVERDVTLRRGGEILGLIGDKGLLRTAKTL